MWMFEWDGRGGEPICSADQFLALDWSASLRQLTFDQISTSSSLRVTCESLVGRLAGGWLVGWLAGWLVGWLAGWLAELHA